MKITKQDIGRTFRSKDGLLFTVHAFHTASDEYVIAYRLAKGIHETRAYHISGENVDTHLCWKNNPQWDFDTWVEHRSDDKPERPEVLDATTFTSAGRKPLIVFKFDSTVQLKDVKDYLTDIRAILGDTYQVVGSSPSIQMSIVDTKELKVTKVL